MANSATSASSAVSAPAHAPTRLYRFGDRDVRLARPVAACSAASSASAKRPGVSRASSVSQATNAPRSSQARRHWDSRVVLPKPRGAVDQDRCAFVQVVPAAHQCAPQHSGARQARRRRLQDELRLHASGCGPGTRTKRIRSRRVWRPSPGASARGDRLCCAGLERSQRRRVGAGAGRSSARSPGRIGRGGRSPPALRGQRTPVTRYLASLKTPARKRVPRR